MSLENLFTLVDGVKYSVQDILGSLTVESVEEEGGNHIIKVTTGEEFIVNPDWIRKRETIRGGGKTPAKKLRKSDLNKVGHPINPVNAPGAETQSNEDLADRSKLNPQGGRSMTFERDGRSAQIPANAIKNFPPEYAAKETLTKEDFEAMIASAESDQLKRGFTTLFNRMMRDTEESTPETPATDPLPATGLTASSEFTKKPGGRSGKRTEEEKAAAKVARKDKEAARLAQTEQFQHQLAQDNDRLKEHPDFVEIVGMLKDILAVYGGDMGMAGVVTTTNTRLKARITNNVAPADRVYHPGVTNPDSNKSGAQIEAKYAKGEYDVELEESAPGGVLGMILYAPPGLKASDLESLTSVMTQQTIRNLHKTYANSNGKGYVKIPVNKFVLIQILAPMDNVKVYHLTKNGVKDPSKEYLVVEPRISNEKPWFALKAYDSQGKVAKLACAEYIPIQVFRTTTMANANLPHLTQLLFGRSLLAVSQYTEATKLSQLTPASAAKFTGDPEQGTWAYTGFMDTNTVPSYQDKKTRGIDAALHTPKTVTLRLPETRLSEPSDKDKPKTPQFVKARFNEPAFKDENRGLFAQRTADIEGILGELGKRVSQSSKTNEALRKAARSRAILDLALGLNLHTSAKSTALS